MSVDKVLLYEVPITFGFVWILAADNFYSLHAKFVVLRSKSSLSGSVIHVAQVLYEVDVVRVLVVRLGYFAHSHIHFRCVVQYHLDFPPYFRQLVFFQVAISQFLKVFS